MDEDRLLRQGRDDFIEVMESFPCMFNVAMVKKPSQIRLKQLIETLEEEERGIEEFPGEKVACLNVLTWLHFLYGDMESAKKKNNQSLKLTSTTLESIVSLGNRAFLAWYLSVDLAKYLEKLSSLKISSYFSQSKQHARSEQAYLLYRLGGKHNLSQSICIYKGLVEQQPENYQWKYFIGLIRRRLSCKKTELSGETEQLFLDIAENAPSNYLKSLALSEMAALHSESSPACKEEVHQLINKALDLEQNSYAVYRNCGNAMKKLKNVRAIELYGMSIKARPSSLAHHYLANCYSDHKINNGLNRGVCKLEAIRHLKIAYTLCNQNLAPMVDLLMLCNRSSDLSDQCLEESKRLVHNWTLREVQRKPFGVAKIFTIFYQQRSKQHNFGEIDEDKSLAIAVLNELYLYKQKSSTKDMALVLKNILGETCSSGRHAKHISRLSKDCTAPTCARQLLIQWNQQECIQQPGFVQEQVEQLLNQDMSHEALLILDTLDLCEENVGLVSEEIQCKTLLQEAKSQLSLGLVSCKLLFHRLFNFHYSLRQSKESPDKEAPMVDVIILHDGPQWKPLFSTNAGERKDSLQSVRHSRVYEDLLLYLFDLEVVSNPWLPFSGEDVSVKFAELVKEYQVGLVLVLKDSNTSMQFLQIADFLLKNIVQGGGSGELEGGASHSQSSGITTDAALLDLDNSPVGQAGEDDLLTQDHLMPNLGTLRRLPALDCASRHQDPPGEGRAVPLSQDITGTGVLDVYFSGDVDKAMAFFKSLLPR